MLGVKPGYTMLWWRWYVKDLEMPEQIKYHGFSRNLLDIKSETCSMNLVISGQDQGHGLGSIERGKLPPYFGQTHTYISFRGISFNFL